MSEDNKKKLKVVKKDHQNWKQQRKEREEMKVKDPEDSRLRINTTDDLFNNPWINEAKKMLSEEQKEQYRKMGERFYSGWDFENGGPEGILDIAVAEISEAIKSGLHPSDLDDNEREILITKVGKDWYTHFGYTEEDLNKINV